MNRLLCFYVTTLVALTDPRVQGEFRRNDDGRTADTSWTHNPLYELLNSDAAASIISELFGGDSFDVLENSVNLVEPLQDDRQNLRLSEDQDYDMKGKTWSKLRALLTKGSEMMGQSGGMENVDGNADGLEDLLTGSGRMREKRESPLSIYFPNIYNAMDVLPEVIQVLVKMTRYVLTAPQAGVDDDVSFVGLVGELFQAVQGNANVTPRESFITRANGHIARGNDVQQQNIPEKNDDEEEEIRKQEEMERQRKEEEENERRRKEEEERQRKAKEEEERRRAEEERKEKEEEIERKRKELEERMRNASKNQNENGNEFEAERTPDSSGNSQEGVTEGEEKEKEEEESGQGRRFPNLGHNINRWFRRQEGSSDFGSRRRIIKLLGNVFPPLLAFTPNDKDSNSTKGNGGQSENSPNSTTQHGSGETNGGEGRNNSDGTSAEKENNAETGGGNQDDSAGGKSGEMGMGGNSDVETPGRSAPQKAPNAAGGVICAQGQPLTWWSLMGLLTLSLWKMAV